LVTNNAHKLSLFEGAKTFAQRFFGLDDRAAKTLADRLQRAISHSLASLAVRVA
jgi:hypothetical protein